MKKLFLITTLLLIMAQAALAAVDVKISWTAKAGGDTRTAVRIYEKVGTIYTLVAEVADPATSYTIPNVAIGTHTYVGTAWNTQIESGYTAEQLTTIFSAPGIPAGFTTTIIVR